MIYKVRHHTNIEYATPVSGASLNIRLKPVPWARHDFSAIALGLDPVPARLFDHHGPYLVNTTRAEFDADLATFDIYSSFIVEVSAPDLPDRGPKLPDLRQAALQSRDLGVLAPTTYLHPSRIAGDEPEITRWAEAHFQQHADILDAATGLSSDLHEQFSYISGATDATTSPAQAFAARHGVCQDFAHILIIALRAQGVPAAYVSGYLRTTPPPGQEKLVGADAMHAWVNVWCGKDLGWVGVDPTNNCLASADHIQIAMGRDYADVAPIDGTFIGGAPQSMTSFVDVENLE